MLDTILDQHRQIVGTFASRKEAGIALDRIVLSGFPIAQIFLLGKDGEESFLQMFPLINWEALQARRQDSKKECLSVI
jgi:hypothetical protein